MGGDGGEGNGRAPAGETEERNPASGDEIMSLGACPECFGQMSSRAPTCPHCGFVNPSAQVDSKSSADHSTPQNYSWIGALVWGFVIFLLLLSNPSRADHELRMREIMREQTPVASFFGAGWLASKLMGYESYGLFSLGTWDGEVLTVGVLGRVYP